jgi:quinolinate synthase
MNEIQPLQPQRSALDSLSPESLTPGELIDAIGHLKKKKNAVIMAHYYQESGIQDIADYVGDSLGLAQEGAKTSADIILLAGVVFMGETAKILNPQKKVLVPDLDAGCSLADNCPADEFAAFTARYPDHVKVTYVNCSAEVKGLSDILCTSSNAVRIIESIPVDTPILFAPDQHLGRYLIRKTGREMVLWEGACIVHENFDAKNLIRLQARHPKAALIAHPECPEAVLDLADHIGSTSSLLAFARESDAQEIIVVTESGILHQMQKACPEKKFIAAQNSEACNCAECPFMRLNTMQKIYLSLLEEKPEIKLDQETIRRALIPLERMLSLS